MISFHCVCGTHIHSNNESYAFPLYHRRTDIAGKALHVRFGKKQKKNANVNIVSYTIYTSYSTIQHHTIHIHMRSWPSKKESEIMNLWSMLRRLIIFTYKTLSFVYGWRVSIVTCVVCWCGVVCAPLHKTHCQKLSNLPLTWIIMMLETRSNDITRAVRILSTHVNQIFRPLHQSTDVDTCLLGVIISFVIFCAKFVDDTPC